MTSTINLREAEIDHLNDKLKEREDLIRVMGEALADLIKYSAMSGTSPIVCIDDLEKCKKALQKRGELLGGGDA